MKTRYLATFVAATIGLSGIARADDSTLRRLPALDSLRVASSIFTPEAEAYDETSTDASIVDDHAAPPAAYYTSYRGLGFMGTCCEVPNPCAVHLWDGYDPRACYHPTLLDHLRMWVSCDSACGKDLCGGAKTCGPHWKSGKCSQKMAMPRPKLDLGKCCPKLPSVKPCKPHLPKFPTCFKKPHFQKSKSAPCVTKPAPKYPPTPCCPQKATHAKRKPLGLFGWNKADGGYKGKGNVLTNPTPRIEIEEESDDVAPPIPTFPDAAAPPPPRNILDVRPPVFPGDQSARNSHWIDSQPLR